MSPTDSDDAWEHAVRREERAGVTATRPRRYHHGGRSQGELAKLTDKPLYPRERQCVRLLAYGHDRQHIAAILNLSEATVRMHLVRAGVKLGQPIRAGRRGAADRDGNLIYLAATSGLLGPIGHNPGC